MILKCRYVVPVDQPIIEDGAIRISEGRIREIGKACDLSGEPIVDHGESVICPAFVNAHTHLELSDLAGRFPTSDGFADWLGKLAQTPATSVDQQDRVASAIGVGVEQSLAAGVTTVGDITRQPAWTRKLLSKTLLKGVSFGEVIAVGSRRHLLDPRLDAAASLEDNTERFRCGISPHAPYTVEPDGLRACAERATSQGLPLAIHLAETPEEEAFTRSGQGALATHLRKVGVWDEQIPVSGCTPVQLAHATGVLGPRTIVAHGNYISDEDMALLKMSGASVAYCPRTHHAFDHAPHPFRSMLAIGINVCVGTDSLASNPSLSILDELRFLRSALPDLDANLLLAMGTLHGARALVVDADRGSLSVGKRADMAVIPLQGTESANGWTRILDGDARPRAVYVDGADYGGTMKA